VVLVAVLWVLGAVALAVMSFYAHSLAVFPYDVQIEEWVQQLHQPAIVRFINFASDANWPTPAGIVAICVIVALALFRHYGAAFGTAITGFGADLANVTLNKWVARPRPHNVHIHTVQNLGLHSFPSGHVTHVIAFYGFLLYLSVGYMRTHRQFRLELIVLQVICLYFIIFIGPSRVLEGEHWPSDVVASYLLGALVLILGMAGYHAIEYLAHGRPGHSRPEPAAA
jgi:undecaprenyl-diphosphatase